MNILITGASGFLGKNLYTTLELMPNVTLQLYDREDTLETLNGYTKTCDFVYHLAGINRPESTEEFYDGNSSFTKVLCDRLYENGNKSPIVVSSTIHADYDSDYGKSKRQGEDIIREHSKKNDSEVYIYRLKNLFGKWSKPNYNSVVATWCHCIANNKQIDISNPDIKLDLCYVDDVVNEFINALMGKPTILENYALVKESYTVTLDEIATLLKSFKASRENKYCIKTGDSFTNKLYATYLSYLSIDDFGYELKMNIDERGSFTEFMKFADNGQVSVNISKPGIVKGNHWHHTKNEKFLVVSGNGVIRFRNISDKKVIEYQVNSDKLEVIDIPTGYTHNIENLGNTDLVTIMWANESFDPNKPDTYFLEV